MRGSKIDFHRRLEETIPDPATEKDYGFTTFSLTFHTLKWNLDAEAADYDSNEETCVCACVSKINFSMGDVGKAGNRRAGQV